MANVERIITVIRDFIWGYPLLILLFGTHIFLTFKLRFIQKYTGRAIKISLGREKEGEGDVSQFGALTTALAATIGTGNIVGVSTAIAAGGPGAVFWMWLTGVFGIATKYSEALLAVKYRVKTKDGMMAGGPMYVIEKGMNMKWLAVVFAALMAVTAFGLGNIVQANSVSMMVKEVFHIAPWITGAIVTILVGFVIIGGIKKIASVCEMLVPFMAIFFVLGNIILLVLRYETFFDSLWLILKSAFAGSRPIVGGFIGAGFKEAIRFGAARGLFSNESGMGSAPIVAAAAQTKNPTRQALVSSSGTFWDTVVMCLITGIVIVNCGYWVKGFDGAALTKATFNDIPVLGPIVLAVGLLTFVFATIIAWSYYGEKAAEYLFGSKITMPYRWAWVVMVFVGSILSLNIVWTFADIANGIMIIPNLISLIVLSGVVVAETKQFLWDEKIAKPEK